MLSANSLSSVEHVLKGWILNVKGYQCRICIPKWDTRISACSLSKNIFSYWQKCNPILWVVTMRNVHYRCIGIFRGVVEIDSISITSDEFEENQYYASKSAKLISIIRENRARVKHENLQTYLFWFVLNWDIFIP